MANALVVISKPGSFRRAGRTFTPTPTVVLLTELSTEQVQALKGEPLLTVREIDTNSEGKNPESKKKAA